MEIKLRRLPPSGELGYPLERLQIDSTRQGTEVSVRAAGFYLEPEFLVLRGSEAFVEPAPAFERPEDRGARELREALIQNETLVRRGPRYVFASDYLFHSASLAASVILARAASGPEEWRAEDWTKLVDLDSE